VKHNDHRDGGEHDRDHCNPDPVSVALGHKLRSHMAGKSPAPVGGVGLRPHGRARNEDKHISRQGHDAPAEIKNRYVVPAVSPPAGWVVGTDPLSNGRERSAPGWIPVLRRHRPLCRLCADSGRSRAGAWLAQIDHQRTLRLIAGDHGYLPVYPCGGAVVLKFRNDWLAPALIRSGTCISEPRYRLIVIIRGE
jgi:hypothetical protein